MSIAGISSEPNKMLKFSSSQWRINDSEELDVFEAARYFSDANENPGNVNDTNFSEKDTREERQPYRRVARLSLDMPMVTHTMPPQNHVMDQNQMKENKKHKHPSSPAAKLASFLNSLFNRTSSKKKKSKSVDTKDVDRDQESPRATRKRRSSISHFNITSNNRTCDSKSVSGFRTPPHYAKTPIKSYKEFRSFIDHENRVSVPDQKGENNLKPTSEIAKDSIFVDEKIIFSDKVLRSVNSNVFSDSNSVTNSASDREFRKFSDADDGADSDSSSDLFDLPNHDLFFHPTGLPVYETTHMDRIKI